jgi:hypothetical protein
MCHALMKPSLLHSYIIKQMAVTEQPTSTPLIMDTSKGLLMLWLQTSMFDIYIYIDIYIDIYIYILSMRHYGQEKRQLK